MHQLVSVVLEKRKIEVELIYVEERFIAQYKRNSDFGLVHKAGRRNSTRIEEFLKTISKNAACVCVYI